MTSHAAPIEPQRRLWQQTVASVVEVAAAVVVVVVVIAAAVAALAPGYYLRSSLTSQ